MNAVQAVAPFLRAPENVFVSDLFCVSCCCCLISLSVVSVGFFFFFIYLFYKIATVTINGYFILTPSMSMIKQIQ